VTTPRASNFSQLLDSHPRFEFGTQFAPVGAGWNTTISFFNYFNQVFKQQPIEAELLLAFFGADGCERGAFRIGVAPQSGMQVDGRNLGISSDGMVAVAAVPLADIEALAGNTVKLRRHIGTGFYVCWEKDEGHRDVMHEWTPVTRQPLPSQVQYAGFSSGPGLAAQGLVITNPTFGSGDALWARPRLEILDMSGNPVDNRELPAIPPMGTQRVELSAFTSFAEQMSRHGRAVARVTSANVAGLFTFERHGSGDFHLHHL
jgi:hypothetical protein